MRKVLTLSLALLLTLSLTAAYAQSYTAGGYYTIDYPDELTLDDTSYTDENTETYTWLFLLEGDEYLIDASLSVADQYQGVSLFSADDATKQAYVKDTMDSYADFGIKQVDTLTVSGVPFYLFSLDEGDGPYYYAETIANGNSLVFSCYYDNAETPLDSALLTKFEAVLKTFRPVTGKS